MPICRMCNTKFPNRVKYKGEWKNLGGRKFCLSCSPYGSHNTSAWIGGRQHLCGKCGESNPKKFYSHRKSLCVRCDNIRSMDKQKETKRKIVEYLGGSCSVCGYNRCLRSLCLHHPGSDKDINFSHIKNWKWERVVSEIEKCILICANCHGEAHADKI
jgi:hypothetical protein